MQRTDDSIPRNEQKTRGEHILFERPNRDSNGANSKCEPYERETTSHEIKANCPGTGTMLTSLQTRLCRILSFFPALY